MRTAKFLALLPVLLCLQARQSRAAEPAKLPAEIQSLIDFSQAAPPEFAADALLRIVESGRVDNRDAQRDLVEQAFQLAAHAQQPVRRVATLGSQVDTRAGYRAIAMKLGLDALSLECRAIRQMLRLDKPRARELFTNLAKPALEPLPCEEALVYNVDDFYTVLEQILASTFTAEEMRRGEHVQFLTTYISRITAHAELAPAARLLASANLRTAELEMAAGAFAAKLEAMPSDDRSFSTAVVALQRPIEMLSQALRRESLSNAGLIRAFRGYLTSNLSGPRCGDHVGSAGQTSAVAAVVDWFNTGFRGEAPPIKGSEAQPSSVGASAKIDRYWTSAEAKQIMTDTKALRFGQQNQVLSEAERSTLDWNRALMDLLTEVDNWKPGDEASEADYFHQKSIVYEAMLELTP